MAFRTNFVNNRVQSRETQEEVIFQASYERNVFNKHALLLSILAKIT